jgi:hypothetical protein
MTHKDTYVYHTQRPLMGKSLATKELLLIEHRNPDALC